MTNHTATDLRTLTDPTTFTGSWVLDPNRTVIRFQTKILWVINVNGTFRALEGRGSVAADGTLSGSLVIDMASVDTRIAKRDHHLRTPDFFDVEKYPTMTFTATSGRVTSTGKAELVGDLVIHGQTRPLTLLADVSTTKDSLTLSSEVDLDRSDWGVSWAKGPGAGGSLKIRVVITAHFERA